MKKHLLIITAIILLSNSIRSQNQVVIPDANFVSWLQTNYPTAMTGNLMDTTDATIITSSLIVIDGVTDGLPFMDLTGIKYFKTLNTLMYTTFNFVGPNQDLPELPNSLAWLDITGSNITSIVNVPTSLQTLYANNNKLTSLPVLPNSLGLLFVSQNQLTTLPNIPNNLTLLECMFNNISYLPSFSNNNVLIDFQLEFNQLTNLPALPATTQTINCGANPIANVASPLPSNLKHLRLIGATFQNLPSLPNGLEVLTCSAAYLQWMPTLPNTLKILECNSNAMLASLPNLPNGLEILNAEYCNIDCFPLFPNLTSINIDNNPFTCVPNHIAAMNATLQAMPICTNSCTAQGIEGVVYNDANTNCTYDNNEVFSKNIPIKIYDTGNNLIEQTQTNHLGTYYSYQPNGTYKVQLDTTNKPYSVSCNFPGADSTVLLNSSTTFANNVNFKIKCKPGADVGVQSFITHNLVFPGQNHTLKVFAGELMQNYNLPCLANTGGSVTITVSGPVTYISPATGALTPNTTAGNIFSYSIPNFSTINIQNAFGLILRVNNTATVSDTIRVNVNVQSIVTDINPSNNTFAFKYRVVNSLDPNFKETTPENVPLGFNDWFIYTVHFQNTGNAPAINIEIKDTLDSNLDFSSFEVMNASHPYFYSLKGNTLKVFYNDVFLPDSLSDPDGSQGFVQYRLKPKANWPVANIVKNTAYIYFDFNAPVVTNTTENMQVLSVGINSLVKQNEKIILYPNPTNSYVEIQTSDIIKSIEMYDITGKEIKIKPDNKKIDLSHLDSGMYTLKVYTEDGFSTNKVIKQD